MSRYSNQHALNLGGGSLSKDLERNLKKPKPDPLMNMDYVSSVDQGRFSTIGRLENGVSLLQSAQLRIEKIRSWLLEISQLLDTDNGNSPLETVPKSVINSFIEDKLKQINELVETASFQNRVLLNGNCGVAGKTSGEFLRFVRGSARVKTSEFDGYPVAIYQPPKSSMLMGWGEITPEEIRREDEITVTDGVNEAHYRPDDEESPEGFLANLRKCLMDYNIEVDVFRTKDNRLFFKHNQLGSKYTFKARGLKSSIISPTPGDFRSAVPGIDVAGTIGGESAHGDGGFLMGDVGNRHTDGLVVHFDGRVDYPGQIVGNVSVTQKGISIPMDPAESRFEILSIPSVHTSSLGIGVTTRSGFPDLSSINVTTETERKDALKLLLWSLVYLEYLSKELKIKEDEYVNHTISLLHGNSQIQTAQQDTLLTSKEKAHDMVDQLKQLLAG